MRHALDAWLVRFFDELMRRTINNGPISKSAQKRIVILGGGFGGVYAALHLERLLAHEPDVEICLISHDNIFSF